MVVVITPASAPIVMVPFIDYRVRRNLTRKTVKKNRKNQEKFNNNNNNNNNKNKREREREQQPTTKKTKKEKEEDMPAVKDRLCI